MKKAKKIRIASLLAVVLIVAAVFAGIILQRKIERQQHPIEYWEIIREFSEKYELDPYIVLAVIDTESSWQEEAVSARGALGLMQLMPATGEWIAGKLKEPYDEEALTLPQKNIEYGCWYLNFLQERFDVPQTAVAAYNAGHNAVAKWLKDSRYSPNGSELTYIPYEETRNYVEKVFRSYQKYQRLYPKLLQ